MANRASAAKTHLVSLWQWHPIDEWRHHATERIDVDRFVVRLAGRRQHDDVTLVIVIGIEYAHVMPFTVRADPASKVGEVRQSVDVDNSTNPELKELTGSVAKRQRCFARNQRDRVNGGSPSVCGVGRFDSIVVGDFVAYDWLNSRHGGHRDDWSHLGRYISGHRLCPASHQEDIVGRHIRMVRLAFLVLSKRSFCY
jgi:hypothetical protein